MIMIPINTIMKTNVCLLFFNRAQLLYATSEMSEFCVFNEGIPNSQRAVSVKWKSNIATRIVSQR